MTSKNIKNCPCGTGKTYMDCCGMFISDKGFPSTPLELMRSRYTAYHLVNTDYIARTMKSPAADGFNANEMRAWAKKIDWYRLEIVRTSHDSKKGVVEFIAHYVVDGQKKVLHEISEFHFEDGKWYYVDGIHPI